jgi:hypothetical protein
VAAAAAAGAGEGGKEQAKSKYSPIRPSKLSKLRAFKMLLI